MNGSFPVVEVYIEDHSTTYAMEMPITIRPYTHGELTTLYSVSWRTLKHWLEPYQLEIGPKIGHFYSIRQVEIIFRHLGFPAKLIIDNKDS